MKLKILAALYSLIIGIAMIETWIILYAANAIPELDTKPYEIGLHIAAEIITAVLLIVGGIALWKKRKWGFQIYLISLGMLLYTLIMSPGYYIQKGKFAFVWMFIAFIILTLTFIILSFVKRESFQPKS